MLDFISIITDLIPACIQRLKGAPRRRHAKGIYPPSSTRSILLNTMTIRPATALHQQLTQRFQNGETLFRNLNLSHANLQGLSLPFVTLIDAKLTAANLSKAFMPGAEMVRARLSHTQLINANLIGANLLLADLQGANLQRALLGGAQLMGADLQGANMQEASLSGANLNGAKLRRADLRNANLKGADLSGADLRGANLKGALLDEANLNGTLMPDGSYQAHAPVPIQPVPNAKAAASMPLTHRNRRR